MAARYELKAGKSGKVMFNLLSANSQVVLTSETYETKKAAQNGIKSVAKNAANEKRFEVKTAKDGQFYFVLKATNGEVIGKSDDIGGYPTERPVAPKEIVATIYQAMGIDLTTELPGPQSRPYPVVDFGTQAIKELFA